MSRGGLDGFEDERLLALLRGKLQLNNSFHCALKSSKPKRSKSAYFGHSHEPVNILRAPRNGRLIDVGHKGFRVNHTTGDAVPQYKHVDAVYCKDMFHSRYNTNPSIHYVGKPLDLPYENMPVLARWDLFGYFFLGKISRILNDSYADVKFQNGHKQINQSFNNIIYLKRTKIVEGDYVMVNIINELDQDCWVPGMVQAIDHESRPAVYYVLLYNEVKCTKTYPQLLRIDREQYYRFRDFILFLEGKGINRRERYFQKVEFEYELDLFGSEYNQLKLKYQPILMPSNGLTTLISQYSMNSERFLTMRRDLGKLKTGDRVLARWPDDGWYYPSVVRDSKSTRLAEGQYKVENKLGAVKLVYREDLIQQIPSNQADIKIGDTVVAQHPKFTFAYAPGEICRLPSDTSKLIVRFYDFSECLVSKDGIYKLAPREKFERDVAAIIHIENYWVGRNVMAFNTHNRAYEWGKILGRIKNQRQMLIQWQDGQQSYQNAYYIFTSKDTSFRDDTNRETIEFDQTTNNRQPEETEVIVKYQNEDYSSQTKIEKTIEIRQERGYRNPSQLNRDRATPVLDFSEFFASKRRSKTMIQN